MIVILVLWPFLFSLLSIKGIYIFRPLLAHLQEALHKQHLVYCVRVMSVGCTRIEAEASASIVVQWWRRRKLEFLIN
jgi:hypothetical protein